jgi:hypothetical protein
MISGQYPCLEDPYFENVAVPKLWADPFLDAYDDLIENVAARYDDEPLIREFTMGACMAQYAEPFHRENGSGAAGQLEAAGFTAEVDDGCLHRMIDIHARHFKSVRSTLALGAYRRLDVDEDTLEPESAETIRIAHYCRAVLGERCVLGNNSLHVEPVPADPVEEYELAGSTHLLRIYEHLASYGAPSYIQTARTERICDPDLSLQDDPEDYTGDECELYEDPEVLDDNASTRLGYTLILADQLGVNSVELPKDFWTEDEEDPFKYFSSPAWRGLLFLYDALLEANDAGPSD